MAIIAPYRKKIETKLNVIIGRTTVELDGRRKTVRSKESNLANFITDAVKIFTKADIAILNGGSFRAPISKGNITIGDVRRVLPFNNTISIVSLKGSDLLKIFKKTASLPAGSGAFLHFSKGVVFKTKGKNIDIVTINGKTI
jgi:5'-nucleotidase / UDP-sugar diphosphatase